MFQNLVKMANLFDQLGRTKQSDHLDHLLLKWAENEEGPSPEDLLQEEEWIKSNLPSNEEPLAGLQGEDRAAASAYLKGKNPEEIRALLEELEAQSQIAIQKLQELLQAQSITPQASLMRDFQKLSDLLDQNSFTKEADFFDKILHKVAQGLPPDDFDQEDLEAAGLSYEDDEIQEPSTEELKQMEQDPDDFLYRALAIMDALAQGRYPSLDEAAAEAKDLLDEYDQVFQVQTPGETFDPDQNPELPDNVIPLRRP